MPAASIIFERPTSPVGYAIAWKTGGDFSHVGIVAFPCWVTEAVPFGGVIASHREGRIGKAGTERYHFVFTGEELARGRAFLREAMADGGYDFRAILSFMLNARRQDPDRWFCSELAYGFLNACRPSEFPAVDYLMDPESLRRFLRERLAILAARDKVAA